MGTNDTTTAPFGAAVELRQGEAAPRFLIVCEHASNHIPDALDNLGLPEALRRSHIAWDPGALDLAERLAAMLGAPLVAGRLSRLLYDCNRPPEAPDAVPETSEVHEVPGNRALAPEARAARVTGIYQPFKAALAQEIARHRASLEALVTVHSFTPVYRGARREVEIGLLHGTDSRFVDRMLDLAPESGGRVLRRNEPYSATDGVTHTLEIHGNSNGLLNVMIEVRNDLLDSPAGVEEIAVLLGPWIADTLASFEAETAE